MTNEELAEELRELANLMTIAGEDDFRARRYARLAETIASLPESVEVLFDEGRLREIPGVGDSTATLIEQYLTTGTSDRRRALEEQVPPTVLDLLQLPGVGPKTAKRLYQDLGVTDLESLETALEAGKIRTMKGMSEKAEAKIREGIARIRRRNVERPLYEVLHFAEQIAAALNIVPEMTRVGPAGEARRGREMVRSVHVVAGTDNIGRASVALSRLGLGDGSLTRHVHGEFGGGFPIDVLLTPSKYFGVTWLRETADREHLDALNERAASRELPPLTDDDAWADLDEAAIYDRLGLPYIPPELREGTEAIRRADAGDLPTLVTLEVYRGDLHCHTRDSDGRNTIEEMAEAAIERGYAYLAITDHSRTTSYANGLSIERLLAQIEAVRELDDHLGDRLTLLAGSEVDILPDGRLDYPDDVLAQLDWVVASVHSHFHLSEAKQTARICKAMENPFVRVIGHPTGRLLSSRDPYPVDVPTLIETAAETGVAIELNASPERLDLNAEHCALAREAGVPISINTDAHRCELFDTIRFGLMTARRAWLEPRHVLNTWSVEEIRAFRSPKT